MDIFTVELSKSAERDLKKIPKYITLSLQAWVENVGEIGLSEVRKIKGYHDEPLKGRRQGERSIRLNKAYRAVYIVDKSRVIHLVRIMEVNKHDY